MKLFTFCSALDVFIFVVNFLAIFMCVCAQFISRLYALLLAICEFIDEYRTERKYTKTSMHNERMAENWNEPKKKDANTNTHREKILCAFSFNNNNRQITIHVEVELMPGFCIIVEFACRQHVWRANERNENVFVYTRNFRFICRLLSLLSKHYYFLFYQHWICIECSVEKRPPIVYLNLIANRSIFHVNSVHAPIRQMQMPNELGFMYWMRWCKMHNSLGSADAEYLWVCMCVRVQFRFIHFFAETLRFCGIFWLQCPKRKLIRT